MQDPRIKLIKMLHNSKRTHIWNVAAPKTGSSWVGNMFHQMNYFKHVSMCLHRKHREQEIELLPLLLNPRNEIYSPHQHIKASEFTSEVINKFNIKVFIQHRNIYDVVISARDHFSIREEILPMAHVYLKEFKKMSEEEQFDFIIDLVIPWYVDFFVSWYKIKNPYEYASGNFLYVSYENVKKEPIEQLEIILKTLTNFSEDKIKNLVNKVDPNYKDSIKTKFNKGKTDSGKQLLNQKHKEKVKNLFLHYRNCDFSFIGL